MDERRALLRERRIATRMLARGEQGLAEMLLRLKGVVFGGRYRFECLIAVGGEGAVFLVRDLEGGARAGLVGKVPLHPVHRSFDLTADDVRERRRTMRIEAVLLETNDSAWMPESVGTFQFQNPSLPVKRGGAFTEAEPVLVMERLPGLDLDRWLARMHDFGIRADLLGPVLDRFALELLRSVADLRARGFHYADLRPGNVRVLSRPERHMRLLDAGSLVPVGDTEGRFPHVPAYLPPKVFEAFNAGAAIAPDDATIAVMAGRTLYEIATGDRAFPGEPVDPLRIEHAPVCPGVAETVALLCAGEFPDVATACEHLADKFGLAATATPVSRPVARTKKARPKAMLEDVACVPATPPAEVARAALPAVGGGAWEPAAFLADDVAGLPSADSGARHVAATLPAAAASAVATQVAASFAPQFPTAVATAVAVQDVPPRPVPPVPSVPVAQAAVAATAVRAAPKTSIAGPAITFERPAPSALQRDAAPEPKQRFKVPRTGPPKKRPPLSWWKRLLGAFKKAPRR